MTTGEVIGTKMDFRLVKTEMLQFFLEQQTE